MFWLARDSQHAQLLNRTLAVLAFFVFNAIIYFVMIALTHQSASFFIHGIDDAIPFVPEFVWVYMSLFPVMIYAFITGYKSNFVFTTAYVSCVAFVILSTAVYALVPSVYPTPGVADDSLSASFISWIHSFDRGNTLPSGHAAYAYITLRFSLFGKRFFAKAAYFVWFLLIVASTLLLKQHHVLDILAGICAGWLCATVASTILNHIARMLGNVVQIGSKLK